MGAIFFFSYRIVFISYFCQEMYIVATPKIISLIIEKYKKHFLAKIKYQAWSIEKMQIMQ